MVISPCDPLSGLAPASIACVARGVAAFSVLGIAQVLLHLRFQATLNEGAGQLFEQATFGQKFLGIGAFFQKFIDQFASHGHTFFFLFHLLHPLPLVWPLTTYTKHFTPSIVWHGSKLILAEFLLTVGLGGALAVVSLSFFIRTSAHPLFALILSLVFLEVALNYVPLLLYALHFARHKNVELQVTLELAHKERYARKYQLQSLLLFVPFVVSILAIAQEWLKHSSS
jgi:hypothetical protein